MAKKVSHKDNQPQALDNIQDTNSEPKADLELEQVETQELESNVVQDNDNVVSEEVATNNVVEPQNSPIQPTEVVSTNDDITSTEEIQSVDIVMEESSEETTDITVPPTAPDGTYNSKPKTIDAKKKKIIIWSSVAVVLVVAIVLSITLPIVFYYKDKIMISQGADFTDQKKISKGNIFVLNKDVVVDGDLDLSSHNYSINLNKHSLKVNGTLTYNSDAEIVVNIGTNKSGVFVNSGYLDANSVNINIPNGIVNLESAVQSPKFTIKAKEVTIASLASTDNIEIEAQSVVLKDKVTTETSANIIIKNSQNFLNKADISQNTLQLINTKSTIVGTVANLQLDGTSQAIVYGKITGGIDGGQKVVMMKGNSCEEFKNIHTLALDRESLGNYTTKNCTNIVYIENLPLPAYIDIQERSDGKIWCSVGVIPNATKYMYSVDGGEFEESISNVIDITTQLKSSGAGVHYIKVYAVGDFDIDNLGNKEIVYRDSDFVSREYSYNITLESPSNLKIKKNDQDGKVILSFDHVAFADYYKVVIGDTTLPLDMTKSNSIDIKDYVQNVGDYTIQVTAHSNLDQIKDSISSYISYITTQKLDNVANLSCTYEDNVVSLNWTASDNAKSYLVFINDRTYIVGSTSLTTMKFGLDEVNQDTKIGVVALGYGSFYQESNVSLIYILPQQS